MKDIRTILLAGLLVLPAGLITNVNAQKSGGQSIWHDESLKNLTLADFNTKKNILYVISNNESWLYINIVVPAQNEQKKMLMFGLTTWIDPSGKSKKDLGIMYPYRMTDKKSMPPGPIPAWADSLMAIQGNEREAQNMRRMANFNEQKHRLIENSSIIGLRGFSDTAGLILTPSTNTREIYGWMGYDASNMLHCVVAIPFQKIPLNDPDFSSDFSILFETGFLKIEGSGGGQGSPGGGGRDGGGGGRPGGGGGMSPQQRSGNMVDMQALSVPTKFWIKGITLAEK